MDSVRERATARYQARFTDAEQAAIAGSDLASLTLTLYNVLTGTVLNNRDEQDVLNVHNVTVDAAGLLTWQLQVADTAIEDPTTRREIRRALWTWTWSHNAVLQTGRHVYDFEVLNEPKVS